MIALAFIGFLLTCWCALLCDHRHPDTWEVGALAAIVWLVYALFSQQWWLAASEVAMLFLNAYGANQWRKK